MTALPALHETAPAKVNLSLLVLGRRRDGYHELESIVAFADTGDHLRLDLGSAFELVIDGPFRSALDGENLVTKAVRLANEASGGTLRSGRICLTKNLPVAAGLGGGSADAAAVLRLLQRANPDLVEALDRPGLDWNRIARQLGADVPVCLIGRAALMTGLGEQVSPITTLPATAILLVNPCLPLSTARVFQAFAAPPLARAPPAPHTPEFRNFERLIEGLEASQNDLEPVARRLCPAIGDVLAHLRELPGARLARMSGSGPTSFALFASTAEAEASARRVSAERPQWWVAAGSLR